MHRFYLPREEFSGDTLRLSDREAHHGADVLRLKPGESVEVLDGVGTRLRCEVRRVGRKEIELAVWERRAIAPPEFEITLLQAIVKGKTMETIVQKATELGVRRIVPVQTERVVAQLDEERGQDKQGKWRLTAIEAIKQCGGAWLPIIDVPVTPAGFLKTGPQFDLSLVASLEGDRRELRHWIQSLSTKPRRVGVWIGPEGDFTSAELKLIQAAGARPITLGDLVLRADTAAICSLAVIRHELAWLSVTEPILERSAPDVRGG
jgi:16S rRNA (uracil1498-N3)-methyltransferase